MDLLRPDVEERVVSKQADLKTQHDQHSKSRELFLGQRVLVRIIRPGQAWIPGTVVERNGPLSYLVQVSDNRVWKRHIDHVREMHDSPRQEEPLLVEETESEYTIPDVTPATFTAG